MTGVLERAAEDEEGGVAGGAGGVEEVMGVPAREVDGEGRAGGCSALRCALAIPTVEALFVEPAVGCGGRLLMAGAGT